MTGYLDQSQIDPPSETNTAAGRYDKHHRRRHHNTVRQGQVGKSERTSQAAANCHLRNGID
jgi:hypothetical protein